MTTGPTAPHEQHYRMHAEAERRAEPGRDTTVCYRCRQYVPIVTHDCPAPEPEGPVVASGAVEPVDDDF